MAVRKLDQSRVFTWEEEGNNSYTPTHEPTPTPVPAITLQDPQAYFLVAPEYQPTFTPVPATSLQDPQTHFLMAPEYHPQPKCELVKAPVRILEQFCPGYFDTVRGTTLKLVFSRQTIPVPSTAGSPGSPLTPSCSRLAAALPYFGRLRPSRSRQRRGFPGKAFDR